MYVTGVYIVGFLSAIAITAQATKLVTLDLTYPFDSITASPLDRDTFWAYQMDNIHRGKWSGHGNIWFEMNNFRMTEHAGTHIDAPRHFSKGGYSVDEIPLDNLIRRPAVVVDISERAKVDANTQLQIADLEQWEATNGRIPPRSLILVNSSWGAYWGTPQFMNVSYKPDGNISKLNFPSIAPSAAQWLVTHRNIVGVGIDTTSVESEPGTLYETHQVLQGANLYNIENGANFDKIPSRGAVVTVMPLPLSGGSGSPSRIFAEWRDDGHDFGTWEDAWENLRLCADRSGSSRLWVNSAGLWLWSATLAIGTGFFSL